MLSIANTSNLYPLLFIVVYITEGNLKPFQISEMELFPKILTGYKANSESCQTSKKELFPKIVKTKSC